MNAASPVDLSKRQILELTTGFNATFSLAAAQSGYCVVKATDNQRGTALNVKQEDCAAAVALKMDGRAYVV